METAWSTALGKHVETVWSTAIGKHVKVSVLDDEDGYLYLGDDPTSWIKSSSDKRLSVRKLELDLFGNDGLEEIEESSIGELNELTHVYISWGNNLKCLPNSITKLHKLQVLEICCFHIKELPENLGDLKSLTHLSLEFCSDLTKLPESFGQLESLTHLSIIFCNELVELPMTLGQLKRLTHVSLCGCTKIKSLSNVMETLINLERLEISACSSLKELPPNAVDDWKRKIEIPRDAIVQLMEKNSTLKESAMLLNVSRSTLKCRLKEHNIALKKRKLNTEQPSRSTDSQELPAIDEEHDIDIFDSENEQSQISSVPPCEMSSHSFVLKATYKDDTVKFNFCLASTIEQLHEEVGKRFKLGVNNFKIKYVDAENDLLLLTSISELEDVPISSSNSNTVKVYVFDNDDGYLFLRDDPTTWIESNRRARHLSVQKLKLDFAKSGGLKEIGDSIAELEELTHLYILGGDNLNCLPNTITKLYKLQVLEICCFHIKELPVNLGDLKCLTHLSLDFCLNLAKLPESVGQLESLTHLSLIFCVELTEIPESLGQLKSSLTHVSLIGCTKIESLSNVKETLETLPSLQISMCSSLKDLPPNAFEDKKEKMEIPPEVIMLLMGKNMTLKDSAKSLNVSSKREIGESSSANSSGKTPEMAMAAEREKSYMKEKEVELFFLHPDGYLILKGDPRPWIESNPDKLQSVRMLELTSPQYVEGIGDSMGKLQELIHLGISSEKSLTWSDTLILQLHKLQVLGFYNCDFTELQEWFVDLKDADGLRYLFLEGSFIKSFPSNIVGLCNLQELSLPRDFNLETLLPLLADSVIVSVEGKHKRITWREFKPHIDQNITLPHCQRELASKREDMWDFVKVEKTVSDACSPVLTKSSDIEDSLAYDKNKDMLHKDMKTGISACCPVHTEPLIEVCSVTIYPNDKNKPYKIHGEIFVCDEGGKKQLYKRDQEDYEIITSGGSLLLTDPDSGVVSMVDPVMTINLKVIANIEEKGENVCFAQGDLILGTTTKLCYEETKISTFEGTLGEVHVHYIVVPCGVVADVVLRILKEERDEEDFTNGADIFGTITACYGKAFGHVIEYPSSILYKKLEYECDRVSYGDSIELWRSLVCLPAYSSLLVKVNISLKECGATEQIVMISGSKDFKCTESSPVEKYISVGNFRVLVTLYWGSSYELQSHQQSQSFLSSSIYRRPLPLKKPLFGNSRMEVLSVFIGDEGNKTENVYLCGTILVEHWDGFSYIFRRDENAPGNKSKDSEAVSLKGNLSYRTDQFYMNLRLKCRRVDNDKEDNSHVAIKSCFVLNDYYYERISRQWFDKPLCSIIIGKNGFAAVHYIVFKDAVKATLKISIVFKDSVLVADSFPVVYGNLVAQYNKYKYSTSYEQKYCRSVLFEEPRENDGCRLTEEGEIQLFRNVVSVPMDSSLIVEVDLSLQSLMDGNVEHLRGNVELEIGDFECKKMVGKGYELVFSTEWADG